MTQKQILIDGKEVSPLEMYSDIFSPRIKFIVVSETHRLDKHIHNELKLMQEASKQGRPFVLYVENFCSDLIDKIPKTEEGKKYLEALACGRVKESEHYAQYGIGRKFVWPIFKQAFEKGELRSFGFNGAVEGTGIEKTIRLANIINSKKDDKLNIAICGTSHVVDDKLASLVFDKSPYKEVIQDEIYENKIVKEDSNRYGLDTKLF